jgi:hypothetical protein
MFFSPGRGRRARRRQSFSTSETESDNEHVGGMQANRGFKDFPHGKTASFSSPVHAVRTSDDGVNRALQNDNAFDSHEPDISQPSVLGSRSAALNGFQPALREGAAYQTVPKSGFVIPDDGSVEAMLRNEDGKCMEAAITRVGRTNALKSLVMDTGEVLYGGVSDNGIAAEYNNQSNNSEALQSVVRGGHTGSAAQLFLNASFRGSVSKQLSSQIAKLLMELDAAKDLNIQVTFFLFVHE